MNEVYIEHRINVLYPSDFNPGILYPEYQFGDKNISKKNEVYDMIREVLHSMNYDEKNYNSRDWNPLGSYIKPGMRVLIKPNWVMHFNGNKNAEEYELECLVTHPSCLRAICDYCLIALKGKGSVLIADAPMQDCDLENLLQNFHYNDVLKFYKEHNQPVSFMDLRKYRSVFNKSLVIVDKIMQSGEGIDVDMSELSIHEKRNGSREYQVDNYDYDETATYHKNNKHIYSINKEVLQSDVIINFCKPKSHRLAGFTAAMKNMVGISYDKASLPHRTANSVEEGGDAYPEKNSVKRIIDKVLEDKIKAEKKHNILKATVDRFIYGSLLVFERKFGKSPYIKGIWYGNDTIWRTVIDLNYIVRHANKEGVLHKESQRIVLHFGDMIIAGDHNGPCQPEPKKLGIIMFSDDGRAFDIVFSKMAGFDYNSIPMIKGINSGETDYLFGSNNDIVIRLNGERRKNIDSIRFPDKWKYIPHDTWKRTNNR